MAMHVFPVLNVVARMAGRKATHFPEAIYFVAFLKIVIIKSYKNF
ncbi:hypothetical protein [Janthinobacterium sp. JC611]|nr:hypothetical protein [Janthinobacterium sp. JC611]